MDCSKTEFYFSEKLRMCAFYKGDCRKCDISSYNNGLNTSCIEVCEKYTTEAIKIVQEWSDAHPVKTRLSVLKEHFPNYRRVEGRGEEPEICAEDLFGINCPYPMPDDGVCMKCWNTPIEEE